MDEEQKRLMRELIAQRLQAQGPSDEEVAAARQAERDSVMRNALFAAAERAARAGSVARGGQGVDQGFYQALNQGARADVQDILSRKAEAGRKQDAGIQSALQQQEFEAKTTPKPVSDQELAMQEAQLAKVKAETNKINADIAASQMTRTAQAATPAKVELTPAELEKEKVVGKQIGESLTAGGKASRDLTIQNLEAIRNEMAKEVEQTKDSRLASVKETLGQFGNRLAELPGAIRWEGSPLVDPNTLRRAVGSETAARQQAIQAAVLPGMKTMFPGAISNKESELFTQLSFDPTLSAEENIKKLDKQIAKFKADAASFDAQEQQLAKTGYVRGAEVPSRPELPVMESAAPAERAPTVVQARPDASPAQQLQGKLSEIAPSLPAKYQAAVGSNDKQAAINHFLLMQKDPEYQRLMRERGLGSK